MDEDAVQELAAQCKQGNAGAFDKLVEIHQNQVARLAARLLDNHADLHDLVQEVFLAVFTGIKKFRLESRFSTWLTAIVLNKCRSHTQKHRRRERILRWLHRGKSDIGHQENANTDGDEVVRLHRAIQQLTPQLREPLVLKYFEEMPTPEIASILKISPGAVDIRLTRARQQLKKLLADDE